MARGYSKEVVIVSRPVGLIGAARFYCDSRGAAYADFFADALRHYLEHLAKTDPMAQKAVDMVVQIEAEAKKEREQGRIARAEARLQAQKQAIAAVTQTAAPSGAPAEAPKAPEAKGAKKK